MTCNSFISLWLSWLKNMSTIAGYYWHLRRLKHISWRWNTTRLKDKQFQEKCKKEMKLFFEINMQPQMKIQTVWETSTAFFRGIANEFAPRQKRGKDRKWRYWCKKRDTRRRKVTKGAILPWSNASVPCQHCGDDNNAVLQQWRQSAGTQQSQHRPPMPTSIWSLNGDFDL